MTDTEKTRWLAEKVMGWRQEGALWEKDDFCDCNGGGVLYVVQKEPEHITRHWNPLHSISDAFECLEKWRREDEPSRWYEIESGPPFRVRFSKWFEYGQIVTNDSLPRAICEALLRATGYEEEK